ncbi:MAG: Mg(2+) transporter [Icmadophila ericetorum]|nr:Mg(2+) transporter [Icmadophila ericetorum]
MEFPKLLSQTGPNAPTPDLDDHRKVSLIPVAAPSANSRRPTITYRDHFNGNDTGRDLLKVDERLRETGTITRDFEQIVIDDEDNLTAEHGGTTPSPRRGVSRRNHDAVDRLGRSRDSSTSSRSISPPNSVDAFADGRRRERANTIGSRNSAVDLTLHRTVSGGTHHRRPTFSNGSVRQSDIRDGSIRPEVDVCYPLPEATSKIFSIDFEELEEFAAERNRMRQPAGIRQRHSFSSQGQRPFSGSNSMTSPSLPVIITHSPTGDGSPSSGENSSYLLDEKEKEQNLFNARPRVDRLQSTVEERRFSFFSSELEQTIHAAEIGDLVMPGERFRDLFDLPEEGGAWWLDVQSPTEDELEMFQKAFGIHRLTAEDIQSQENREKVELFKSYYFVCFRSFFQMDKNSDQYMEPVNAYMVVFRDGIITFTYSHSPHATNVRKRIGTLRNFIDLTADWICYAMVDNIVDSFAPVIRSIEVETDQIEDQVFVSRAEDFTSLLRQIGECRKKVMSLMRLLGGKADVIKGFAKRCNEQYSVTPRGEIGLYLGDIQDHVITMMSNLGHFEVMLSRSHSNYLAQLSVDNLTQGNQANKVLGKITLLATVLVPLNLICGLWGMNVPVPGRSSTGLEWFFGIVGAILVVISGSVIAARRMKLL